MKKIYFLTVSVFFLSVGLFAQDQKWSVEANYPLTVGDELGNDAPGILDVGVKYRFLDFNIVKIGAGINAGIFKEETQNYSEPVVDIKETHWLIQPKVFAEFTIPGIQKLHPSVGLGYTFLQSKYKGIFPGAPDKTSTNLGGVSLNLGLSYDITKRFFVQAQYDYTRITDNREFEGQKYKFKQNLGYLKVGVGFRF